MSAASREEEYASRIRTYVFNNFVFRGDPADIPLDQSLVDGGVIDSYAIVELATWLEHEFSITIEDEEMTKEHFGSIVLMARFILRKQREAAIVR